MYLRCRSFFFCEWSCYGLCYGLRPQREVSISHHPATGTEALTTFAPSGGSLAATGAPRRHVAAVIRVASGNFLEMYDFIVYGYYASYIARTYFPAGSEFASLMLSLMTFGVGFLMRPIGAIVLGAYMDRRGRRQGLIVTLGLMAIGTLTIAITPSYASIGLAAPMIVVAGRLLQGLSAGVELGGVSVYLAEIATPGRRGFYCSWQSASQQVAVAFTALIGLTLTGLVSGAAMSAWGWRIPLLIGCLIIPVILWLRRSLPETAAFQHISHPRRAAEVLTLVAENSAVVLTGMLLVVFTTSSFYLITAYTPTFGRQALHLDTTTVFLVTMFVGVSNFIWLPVGGTLSDRIGRRPLLYAVPLVTVLTAYPAMLWLVATPSFARLLLVELWLSMCFGLYNGAMVPYLTELMPPRVRTAAFAFAYSLATALFGGFTPAICTYLIERTANKAAPALWLMSAAILSAFGALLSRRFATAQP
jgi:MFS transporter, MHS family, citrate/tricarballylate:H+ symporter